MVDVHISYKFQDAAFAEQVYTHLVAEGFSVWMDSHSVQPGMDWEEAWHQSLREARVLVVILTQESANSIRVSQEWGYFLVQRKPVIPLLLASDDIVPPDLKKITYILTNQLEPDEALRRLDIALRNFLISTPTDSNEVVMQIADADILTPETLSDVITPFISALTELQHMIDRMHGRSVQPVRIRQISQNSEIKITIDGLKEIIEWILERLSRPRRELKQLEVKEKEEEIRSDQLDNALKDEQLRGLQAEPILLRIALEAAKTVTDKEVLALILELTERFYPQLPPAERAEYIVEMKPSMEKLQKSGVQFASIPPIVSEPPPMPNTLPS